MNVMYLIPAIVGGVLAIAGVIAFVIFRKRDGM
jgi:hypothetical protein